VAWCTTQYVFEARQAGQPVRYEGNLTMVWVRQPDGSQKLAVFHASHLPVAAAS
jgi:ketosteroid isomerase-like protein